MIYNLIEACVVTGLSEIYESIKNNSVAYDGLIKEIQSIWSNYKIGVTIQRFFLMQAAI
jgi:hypothetical protein